MPVQNGDILRVTTHMNGINSQDIQNVYHFQAAFETEQSDQDVANSVGGYLAAAWDHVYTRMSNEVSTSHFDIVGLELIDHKWTVTRVIGSYVWTLAHAFSDAGGAVTDGDAVLLRFPTSLPKVTGKKYLYGLGNASVTESQIESSPLADFVLMAISLITNAVVSGDNHLIPGLASTKWEVFVPLVSGVIDSIIAYQRRRKAGVGV